MRCKDAKSIIKRLERENFELRHRARANIPEERSYDFNLLEIVVRPKRNMRLMQYDMINIDMRVVGSPEMEIPAICTVKRIQRAAIHLVKENRRDFIKQIGEIMARELVDFADKEMGRSHV